VSDLTEPGRHVADDGLHVYAWPPEGRFADLWRRIGEALPSDDDKDEAASLLCLWLAEDSTDVAYIDDGELVDVEPDWDVPGGWLNRG